MADETVPYQFDTPAELWYEWTDTIPRRTSIDTRLVSLIRQDYRAATRQETDSEERQATVDVLASRINIRCMQAVDALRDDADTDAALDQLQEIQDIADALES